MASLTSCDGCFRVQYVDTDGVRKTIRLKDASENEASDCKSKIEALADSKRTGHAVSLDVEEWLFTIKDKLFQRLVDVGLVSQKSLDNRRKLERQKVPKKPTFANILLDKHMADEIFGWLFIDRDVFKSDAGDIGN
jgi:hypothetical protein